MRREFFIISAVIFLLTFLLAVVWKPALYSLVITVPVFFIGVKDVLQKRHSILRNFPVIGHFRYTLELIRPEIQQYFIERDTDGTPIPRVDRSVVYQRAKRQLETIAFGTQLDVGKDNYEWINHSMVPGHIGKEDLRIVVGGPKCSKPYSSSIFNISGMSYGSLSKTAILAMSLGAKKGNFYHNTGEGGVSPYHLEGGADLVWQIGTGYFGCRNEDGSFSDTKFAENALKEQVKMIEVKISQGAKPGHGGILPGAKVTQEIAEIRGVRAGETVFSPSLHSAFSTPLELVHFVEKLRQLSGGKPVGIKLCIGRRHEFVAICKAMIQTGLYIDFITIDGAEGGTGASPVEYSNSVGTPLADGLNFVNDILLGYDLKKHIRVIASGKVFTALQMIKVLSLGADIVNSARGMMLAVGCIQALRCNANVCPAGVATTDPKLYKGLDPNLKSERIYNYHLRTIEVLVELLETVGVSSTKDLDRSIIHLRMKGVGEITLNDLYPLVPKGCLLTPETVPHKYRLFLERAQASSFKPAS